MVLPLITYVKEPWRCWRRNVYLDVHRTHGERVKAERVSSSAARQPGRSKTRMVAFGHATEKVAGFLALTHDQRRHLAIIVIHEWWGLKERVKEQAESGGDKPPRPECAPLWHTRLLRHLPNIRLTLLLGQYAQRYYLASNRKATMSETVQAFSEYAPQFFPSPHPSWRSVIWMRQHPCLKRWQFPRFGKLCEN